MLTRCVLVTRPQPQADETAALLRREGFDACIAPLTEYIPLSAVLPDLGPYQALLFTSAQGVRAFAERSPERRPPAFCVGEATAGTAADAGFQEIYSADGDALAAAELVRSKKDSCGLEKILHVCGEDTARDMKPLLESDGIAVDSVAVYKAKLIERLPPDAARALREGRVTAALLFSARTAARLVKILQQEEFAGASRNIEAVCISARVARALEPLPWKSVRTARTPDFGSMLEILRMPPPAGGAIVDGGQTLKEAGHPMTGNQDAGGQDRRVKTVPPDESGLIRAEGYTGPDRRAYHENKRQKVMKEKMAFLNRTTLSAAFLTAAVLYAVYFLLAPEIAEWDANALRVKQMETQMAEMNRQMDELRKEKEKSSSLGSTLNRAVEQAQGAASGAAQAVAGAVAETTGPAKAAPAEGLIRLLSEVQAMNRTEEGRAGLAGAMTHLKAALSLAGQGGNDINAAVGMARLQDPALNRLLANVMPEHLGAAALLLAVNDLRGHIEGGQPFADDLGLVVRLAGSEPVLRAALEKLAPYAATGIAGKAALQEQFRGLAGDIVMAKLAGQDVSIKEQALKRLSKLVKVRKIDDIEGDSVDSVVARAEFLLGKGDVAGATGALGALQGAPAEAAAPWVAQANGYVAASGTSEVLSQTILQVLSSATSENGFSLEGMIGALKENLNVPDSAPAPDAPVYLSPSMQNDGQPGGGLSPYAPK